MPVVSASVGGGGGVVYLQVTHEMILCQDSDRTDVVASWFAGSAGS